MKNIELVITPKAKDLGDNFVVRRALPDIQKRSVGPFIFWDHMGPVEFKKGEGMKVRAHPHIGLATITWLFSGEIMHRDSLGNEQPIRPGEVNWMTAGKGIVHSERSQAQVDGARLEGIQLWLALPKAHEEVEPSFYHCKEHEVPLIELNGVSLRLIAGKLMGSESPVPVYSDLFYCTGKIGCEQSFELDLDNSHEAAIYVVSGKLKVGDQLFDKYSMITFKAGSTLKFEATEDAEFMLLGGEVLPEKRHMWWNFVSTDKAKIMDAKRRWKEGEFPDVINENELIPLPKD